MRRDSILQGRYLRDIFAHLVARHTYLVPVDLAHGLECWRCFNRWSSEFKIKNGKRIEGKKNTRAKKGKYEFRQYARIMCD